MMKLAAATAALIVPLAIHAQQPVPRLEFDAVSIKPSDPDSHHGTVVSFTPGGGLRVLNATLKDLIETAYDVRLFQIVGGPSWCSATRFDIIATPGPRPDSATAPTGNNRTRLEVQAVLQDRFQFQFHRETRIGPIYSLAVAKGGIKPDALRASPNPPRGINAGQGSMLGEATSMANFAYKLSRLLDHVVVNDTGLPGNYDFKLQWTPDTPPPDSAGQPAEPAIGSSLFTAIQEQLGLRLEAKRGPIDVLVIDRVEKPSEN